MLTVIVPVCAGFSRNQAVFLRARLMIMYTYKNILYGKLEIRLTYQDSGKSYLVQAADLIAGTTRGRALSNIDSDIDIINHKLLFP